MADNMQDIEFHNEISDYRFSTILNEMTGVKKEVKEKMMKEFIGLSMYYKNNLLDQLEKFESNRIKFVEKFLFESKEINIEETEREHMEELDDLVKSKAQVHKTMFAARKASEEKKEESAPEPIKFSKTIEKKEYESMKQLDALIGLDRVKQKIKELIAVTELSKYRQQYNLKPQTQSLHMIFKGNPGTGKTTVARLLGQILHEIGVLSKGHVIELDRSHLVSRFQGDIEQRIVKYAEDAEGGILFIDEVYSLHQPGDLNDQGKQGIEVLLKVIEDKRDDFICIGAGYVDEVNAFLASNPGLVSRFPIHIDFEDYTNEQLLDIAMHMFRERDYTEVEDSFIEQFNQCIEEERKKENFANGRIVRNIVEAAIREQSLRLYNKGGELTEQELVTIIGEDFKYEPVTLQREKTSPAKASKEETKEEDAAEKVEA